MARNAAGPGSENAAPVPASTSRTASGAQLPASASNEYSSQTGGPAPDTSACTASPASVCIKGRLRIG